jgi:putative transposase
MLPRRVVAGTTYKITRRTVERQFFLRPSPEVNAIILYALASAVLRHGMQLHAWVAMANHPHVQATDVRGVLPAFLHDFHREVALALKALHGIAECVWAKCSTSAVELHGERAQADAALYAMLNPVVAGLVEHAADWPGAIWLPGQRELVVRRPDVWFSEDRPEELRVPIVPPPAWTGTEDQWHEHLAERLAEREATLRKERIRERRAVLGRQRVLQNKVTDRPWTTESVRPARNPVLAAAGEPGLMAILVTQLRAWRRAYIEARDRWRTDKTAVFPPGTWWKVVHDGAAMAA